MREKSGFKKLKEFILKLNHKDINKLIKIKQKIKQTFKTGFQWQAWFLYLWISKIRYRNNGYIQKSIRKRRIDRRWQKNIREKYYQNQENLIDLFKKSPPIKANSKELNKAVEESNKDVFENQYEKGRYNTEFHINTSPNLNNSIGEDFKRTREIEDVLKKLKGRVGN